MFVLSELHCANFLDRLARGNSCSGTCVVRSFANNSTPSPPSLFPEGGGSGFLTPTTKRNAFQQQVCPAHSVPPMIHNCELAKRSLGPSVVKIKRKWVTCANRQVIQARAICREIHDKVCGWQDRTAWVPMESSDVPRRSEGRLELVALTTVTLFLKPGLRL